MAMQNLFDMYGQKHGEKVQPVVNKGLTAYFLRAVIYTSLCITCVNYAWFSTMRT